MLEDRPEISVALLDIVEERLVPSSIRRFVTFRSATVLVALLVITTALVRAFVPFSAEYAAQNAEHVRMVRSPAFLIGYNVFAAISFAGLYASRPVKRLYYMRVAIYAMVLTGFLVLWVSLALPLRSS